MNHTTNGKLVKPEIAFDDDPPRPGPRLFIRRLKGSESVTVAILGNEVRGVWHHWNGGKSEPHYKQSEMCPGCVARRPKRWKGYLHVFDYQANQQIVLELTNHAARQLWSMLGRKEPLRGERIKVTRSKSDAGRLTVTVLAAEQKIELLPAEEDVRPLILKLWGVDQDEDDEWLGEEGENPSDQRFKL